MSLSGHANLPGQSFPLPSRSGMLSVPTHTPFTCSWQQRAEWAEQRVHMLEAQTAADLDLLRAAKVMHARGDHHALVVTATNMFVPSQGCRQRLRPMHECLCLLVPLMLRHAIPSDELGTGMFRFPLNLSPTPSRLSTNLPTHTMIPSPAPPLPR